MYDIYIRPLAVESVWRVKTRVKTAVLGDREAGMSKVVRPRNRRALTQHLHTEEAVNI